MCPPDLLDSTTRVWQIWPALWVFNLIDSTKEGSLEVISYPRGQNQWHCYYQEQQDYIQSADIWEELKVSDEESAFLPRHISDWHSDNSFQTSIEKSTILIGHRHLVEKSLREGQDALKGEEMWLCCFIQSHQLQIPFYQKLVGAILFQILIYISTLVKVMRK